MKQKIIFIDIDGTLFDNNHDKIHQSTIDAIESLRRSGHIVCISSGRSKALGNEVFSRYHLHFDGYVLINGQYVILDDEVIYKNPLKQNFIHSFIDECHRKDVDFGFLTEEETFVSSYRPQVLKAFQDFKMKTPRLIEKEDLKKDIYQGLFFDESTFHYFSQKFKPYVRFIPWLGNGADIISIDASKAVGMDKICDKLGIIREDVIAIGDSTNDIEMLEYAHVGIAMGNAKPALKEVADLITDPIDHHGLYNAFKKLNLI